MFVRSSAYFRLVTIINIYNEYIFNFCTICNLLFRDARIKIDKFAKNMFKILTSGILNDILEYFSKKLKYNHSNELDCVFKQFSFAKNI